MRPTLEPSHANRGESDAQLIGRVAERIAVPRAAAANSFVLHAPLELLARSALLPYVEPAFREQARERISEIERSYTSFEPATFPDRRRTFDRVDDAVGHLSDAIATHDLDAADAAADWLATHLTPVELAKALSDLIIGSLAAAAHAPIFLWLAPRVSPRWNVTGRLLRPLARELARNSTMRLRWIDEREDALVPAGREATGADMFAALASTPRLGEGPSAFIFPTMSRVDTVGLAPTFLGRVSGPGEITGRGRAVMRAAAWSMLNEATTHAPYGWTHALTMSQAALGVAGSCADPTRALAAAATYVFGFRASLAVRPLVEEFEPPRFEGTLTDAFTAGPDAAAAAVWHLPAGLRQELVTHLASRAAVHPDAHQAKYTLACLDAAGGDPQSARLYLTAAARLVGHWASVPVPDEH
jgi:hypothetical protein